MIPAETHHVEFQADAYTEAIFAEFRELVERTIGINAMVVIGAHRDGRGLGIADVTLGFLDDGQLEQLVLDAADYIRKVNAQVLAARDH